MRTGHTFQLTKLRYLVPSISPVQCDYFAEACIVALERQGHKPGVSLNIEGDIEAVIELKWEPVSIFKGWEEERNLAENGSIAIAFYVILELTGYKIVEQAIIGTGFDYWLSYNEDNEDFDPENFLSARLEISGLNKGSWAGISRRVHEKLRQTARTDYLNIPAWIVVTEFNRPITIILQK